jgi:hypothetical protein
MGNMVSPTMADVVADATRTLLAAGFTIVGVHRDTGHIEFKCERLSRLGPNVQFVIAITIQNLTR